MRGGEVVEEVGTCFLSTRWWWLERKEGGGLLPFRSVNEFFIKNSTYR